MTAAGGFLYRGTTLGWPGSDSVHRERKTSASGDPLVATLFAIECLNHGPARVLLAPRASLGDLTGSTNHSAAFESEIVLDLIPEEFAERAALAIDAQQAREILVSIGFPWIPARPGGKSALRETIIQSYNDGNRLAQDQVREFDSRAMELSP